MIEASIVVSGNGDEAPWRRCLEAIRAQLTPNLEVILAMGRAPATAKMARRDFPAMRVVDGPRPLPLQELRALGLAEARGDIIAFLDCFSIVEPGWAEAMLECHRRMPSLAVGGPVDLAEAETSGLLRWALYINEYGMFLPPMAARAMPLLPGCNLSYKRAALADEGSHLWKSFLNAEIHESRGGLRIEPRMAVRLDKPVSFADYWLTRLDHGRCYGAMRDRGKPLSKRLGRALAAPALPFVLLVRWSREYWPRCRWRSKLVWTSPLQMLLFATWALGEAYGSIFGAGRSCRRLFY